MISSEQKHQRLFRRHLEQMASIAYVPLASLESPKEFHPSELCVSFNIVNDFWSMVGMLYK